MAALPYMPLYVADYLADAAHLTTQEHGAYLLLIMNYWQRGGPLPDDDARLARIARMGPREWARVRDNLSEFFEVACGTWSHSRVDSELARVSAKSLKCKMAGRASVQRRFGKRSTDVEPTDTEADTDKEGKSSNEDSSVGTDPPLTKKEILEAWHQRMVPLGFPAVRKMTAQRDRQLKARLKDSTLEEWQRAMDALERSAFCKGDNDRGWRADFDFLLQPKSFTKLLEGAYDH
jgi:uncharacterized protein YdaU (DUF1376 family)